MNQKLIAAGVIILMVFVGISGCNKKASEDTKSMLLGTWAGPYQGGSPDISLQTKLVFFDNNTANISYFTMKDGQLLKMATEWYEFEINGNILRFIFPGETNSSSYNYVFSNNYKSLTLTDVDNPEIKLVLTKETT